MAAKRKAAAKRPAAGVRQGTFIEPPPQPPSPLPERTKLAAADFYSALQRTLDAMQRKLSSANNAFADFVVKEFKVDAAVQLTVNELGMVLLMLADDTMAPQSVSRLTLTLAAVAKPTDAPASVQTPQADSTALADVTWLPTPLVTQLAQYDVKTVSEFLGLVADARFSAQIASLLKVRRADVGRWTNQMRLLGLPDMTAQYVGALGDLGISAIADLAKLDDKAVRELQQKAPKTFTEEVLAKLRDAAKKVLQ